MKTKSTLAAVIALAGITAFAAPPAPDFRPQPGSEFGTVIRSTPISQRQQITTPHQTCVTEQVAVNVNGGQQGNQVNQVNTPNAILGALLGAGLGTQIGGGRGNVAATAAGSVIGAEIGRNSGAGTQAYGTGTQMRDVQRCSTESQVEYRDAIVGYNIVYEYAGIQYTARLARDPGATIALQVTPR